jgi:GT2 family glycosyltransferase
MPVSEFGSSRSSKEWRESPAAGSPTDDERERSVVTSFHRKPAAGGNQSPLTVVICTYARPQRVAGFLTSFFDESYHPNHLIIVDASPGEETERIVVDYPYRESLDISVSYFRVSGPLKGLTSQRNFGLRHTVTSHVAYFDDDVILEPECLMEMERAFQSDPAVVGVAGYNDAYRPSRRLWKIRKALGIVSTLRPGSYQRSGMAVPWSFMSPSETLVSDWLPGCGMMWRTPVLREAGGFNEEFRHYALGEDIDMSLRAGKKGKLLVVGKARYKHLLDEGGGRPNDFKKGYMEIHNRFEIQRRGLADRTWRDVALFTYGWGVDTLMLLRNLVHPDHALPVIRQIGGRLLGAFDLIRGR